MFLVHQMLTGAEPIEGKQGKKQIENLEHPTHTRRKKQKIDFSWFGEAAHL